MSTDSVNVGTKELVDEMVKKAVNDPEQRKEMYMKAMELWTPEAEIRQLMEECAELSIAVNKLWRGSGDMKSVVDEMADVMIMSEQMCVLMESLMNVHSFPSEHKFNIETHLIERFDFKILRLAQRLSDYESNRNNQMSDEKMQELADNLGDDFVPDILHQR